MKTSTLIFALLLPPLAGCAEPLTPASYADDYEDALCAWSSGCGVFESRGQCRDALVWDDTGRFEYLAAAHAAGRVAFDADAAAACIEQVVALPCEGDLLNRVLFSTGPAAAPDACSDVFVGQVRNYDPCMNSEECAGDDAVCGFPPTCNEACCEGSCRVRGGPPELGEACTGTCSDDAFCARDPMTNSWTVCTARRKAGADCSDLFDSCAEGLYCDSGESWVCTKRLAAGASCGGGGQCADGLSCYHLGDGVRECRALPGEGAACSSSNYPPCARIDNYCDEVSNRCTKLGGPGEPCQDYMCVPYAECDFLGDAPTCVARAGLGESCGPGTGPCLGHLRCDEDSRCVEPDAEEVCAVP